MNIVDISTAYDQLKVAQKELNACLESPDDPGHRRSIATALAGVICAQDTLLGLREACVRRDFADSLLREQLALGATAESRRPPREQR